MQTTHLCTIFIYFSFSQNNKLTSESSASQTAGVAPEKTEEVVTIKECSSKYYIITKHVKDFSDWTTGAINNTLPVDKSYDCTSRTVGSSTK